MCILFCIICLTLVAGAGVSAALHKTHTYLLFTSVICLLASPALLSLAICTAFLRLFDSHFFFLFFFARCVPIHELSTIMCAGSDVWHGTGWSEWLQGREKAHYGANYEQRVHFVPIQELTAIM